MFSSFCELLAKLLASLLDRTGVEKKQQTQALHRRLNAYQIAR